VITIRKDQFGGNGVEFSASSALANWSASSTWTNPHTGKRGGAWMVACAPAALVAARCKRRSRRAWFAIL
jgi:hypothetical protein